MFEDRSVSELDSLIKGNPEFRQLYQHHQDLDRRVLERTSELATANEQLKTEVEQRRKTQEQLDYLSYFDTLTGLANRTLLQERLLQASAAAEHRHHFGALLFIDLDHFRTLNEIDGRGWGDSVLREVAKRLRQSVVESDTIARVGADRQPVLQTHAELNAGGDGVAHHGQHFFNHRGG